jgi:hypothetical protein
MYSGDAQAEFELLVIPAFSSFLYSASAILSLSGASRWGLTPMGGWLPVSMWCSTPCVGMGLSVSDLMLEWYFARSHLTGFGMALLTSCSGVLAASELVAVLLQGNFFACLVVAAGAVSAAVAELGRGVIFTSGIGVVGSAMYTNVIGLWSLINTCACRGWMEAETS